MCTHIVHIYRYICWSFISWPHVYVISGRVLTYGNAHSWWLYIVALLKGHAIASVTRFPIWSHYPDAELTSTFPILVMPNVMLGSDIFLFDKSLVSLNWTRTPNLPVVLYRFDHRLCVHTYVIYVYVWKYMYIYMRTCTYVYGFICVSIYIYTYLIYIYICIYMYLYVIYVCVVMTVMCPNCILKMIVF